LIVAVAALLGGLVLLARSADAFVMGAGRLSLTLRVSPVVVGAVVIGFGTSAPELLVSGLAAAQGSLDIAVGNVVGSNIANLTLVAAVAALVVPLQVSSTTLRREAPIAAGAALVFAVAIQSELTRPRAAILLGLLVVALGALIAAARAGGADELGREARSRCAEPEDAHDVRREVTRTVLGLLGTVVAAQLVVHGARGIAEEAGLSEGFVGLTLVAIGTSLPEIVTAVQAARQGQSELIVGNLFGSNIFNSLAVGGTIGMAGPGTVDDPGLTGVATVAMVAAGLLGWFLMGTGRCLVRWEAVSLLVAYAALLPLVA
jgi:cation:H+ antiporter